MPQFQFICQNNQGDWFQGTLEAPSQQHLNPILQKNKLFLVWSREVDLTETIVLAEPSHLLEPLTEAAARCIMAGRWSGEERRAQPRESHQGSLGMVHREVRGSRYGRALLIAFTVGSGVGTGLWWSNRRPPVPASLEAAYPQLRQLKVGMTRGQIEKIFPSRYEGMQIVSATRYSAPGGWVVEVIYDQQGGTWAEQNRMTSARIKTKASLKEVRLSYGR